MVIFQCHVSFTSPNPKIMYIFGQITSYDLTPNGVVVKNKGSHLISGKSRLVKYLNLATYTWNPKDHCFEWKGPSFEGFKAQNRGQTGSRYIYIYTYIYPDWDSTKVYVYISTKKKHQQNISSMSNGFVRRTFWSPWEQSFLG